MSWLSAVSRTSPSAVPSIAAMTSTSTPLVTMFSTWETWVGMSSSAYWRSTS